MSKFDRYLLVSSLSTGIAALATRSLTYLADINLRWTWVAMIFVSVAGVRSVMAYKNKRNVYLLKLTRMLYYKNVANNRGALTLLVDRATDEQFKECLLAYAFLLVPSAMEGELRGLTRQELGQAVEKWLLSELKLKLQFDVDGSVSSLLRLGLVQERRVGNRLVVLPLTHAVHLLPSHVASQVAVETVMGASDSEMEDGFGVEE